MAINSQARIFAFDEEILRRLGKGEPLPTSLLFHHQELFQAISTSPLVERKGIINTLNYIHFMEGQVLVHVTELQYQENYLLLANLKSCSVGEITCRWQKGPVPLRDNFTINDIIITDGLSLMLLPIQVIVRQADGFTAALPEKGRLLGKRCVKRYKSQGIKVSLTQNDILLKGELIDFSPLSFRVKLNAYTTDSVIGLSEKIPYMIILQEGQRNHFSGLCRCIRQEASLSEKELVFEPIEQEIHLFHPRKFRSPRLRACPTPTVHFEHPFFKRPIQRSIHDLTFTGLSIEEKIAEGVLMTGMIIHGLEIRYAGTLNMTCDARVVYRAQVSKGRARYGLAILDMDLRSYRQLSHIMVQAGDPQASFTSSVEMDALWEFFFDTGFIYPRKYNLIQRFRDEIKETVRRLYQEEQEIEAHFTYEQDGQIYGLVSMIRAYQRTWMMQHLTARPLDGRRTGLFVLKNLLRFLDGLLRFPSIPMDYMMQYFRPENHFPNLFFGGFARDLGNPRACSMDLFAFIDHPTEEARAAPFPKDWELTEFSIDLLPELESFYRSSSGGLLLDVLGFGQRGQEDEPLEEVYKRYGFLRKFRTYGLLHGQALKALLVVNRSSHGLNLDGHLNSIKVIVTDPVGVPWTVLTTALSKFTRESDDESTNLLIYPASYPSSQGIEIDRQYILWILDRQYVEKYFEYMDKKTRLTLGFLLKYLLRKLVLNSSSSSAVTTGTSHKSFYAEIGALITVYSAVFFGTWSFLEDGLLRFGINFSLGIIFYELYLLLKLKSKR